MIDTCPIPGMIISPKEGVVPVGGTAELQVISMPFLFVKSRSVYGYWSLSIRFKTVLRNNLDMTSLFNQFSIRNYGDRCILCEESSNKRKNSIHCLNWFISF